MYVDDRIIDFYNNKIKQVFVYITSNCQLHCRQCLYKPLLGKESTDINYSVLQKVLAVFHSLGAYKVSFLGGEPTLYKDLETNKSLTDVIQDCKLLGYRFVRFDTNGQFDGKFLNDSKLRNVDEITFSLDGYNMELNDIVRGRGSFDKCESNIRKAVGNGFNVQITMCVHKYICPSLESGIYNIERMIEFATSLGVAAINFHPILKVGISRDNWIDETDISPYIWMKVYDYIQTKIQRGEYAISVRIPMRFVDARQYESNKNWFSYCPLKLAERALIMPDGTIKVCAFTIGTSCCLAKYDSHSIQMNHSEDSEYYMITNNVKAGMHGAHCLFQKYSNDSIVPLCMSFKPNQDEIVWNDTVGEV